MTRREFLETLKDLINMDTNDEAAHAAETENGLAVTLGDGREFRIAVMELVH